MTFLLYLSNILFTSGQSAVGKQFAKQGGSSLSFNVNKSLIGVVMFLAFSWIAGFSFHGPTVLFGLCYGVSLCCAMHVGFKALAMGPMALTSIIGSFSLIIPFFFGIFFWNEAFTAFKAAGIVLLLASILLINGKKESGFSVRWLMYALLMLVANGICSVIQKMHQLRFPALYCTEFMFWALLCALIVWSAVAVKQRENNAPVKLSLLGLTAGFMNWSANYILLVLSATENASVLFPVVSIAGIIAVWLMGIVFFKERLKGAQALGLILGVVSVLLLKQ